MPNFNGKNILIDEETTTEERPNLYNIYRLTKVRPDEDDATRCLEVHSIDISRKANIYTAINFENGWHVLGYVPNLTNVKRIKQLIKEWEEKK